MATAAAVDLSTWVRHSTSPALRGSDPFNSGVPTRSVSPIDIKQIHSGHSLTDMAMFQGTFPTHGRAIWSEIDPVGNYSNLIGKSTSPGSPISYRWNNATAAPDAKTDIADWELLVITEGVPLENFFWDGTEPGSAWYTSNLASMRLFVEHAWNNGNSSSGAPTLLYATWGELDNPDLATWRTNLDTHQAYWEQMADYGAENLPSGAYVYIVPGNLLMKRLYDDIQAAQAPTGITSINDYFSDNIHTNGLGSYALALLHLAVIHHVNPNILPDPSYGLTPNPTVAQANYLKTVVWEVANGYARAGL